MRFCGSCRISGEIALVCIDSKNPQRAIRAIELIHGRFRKSTIFAVGELSQPTNIVSAMRAGAREFLTITPAARP